VYDRIEAGGSVYEDIQGLDYLDLEDYFGDLDPVDFL
jgi:hypothetical protein